MKSIKLLCIFALCSSVSPSRADQPNMVLIMADDIGMEGLGCYGGRSYRTPHLDKMAAEGLRFTHAYSQPLCTPTRVQIMTGKYNHRNWLYFGILDPKEKTFGHHMKAAGYTTGIFGKWQLQSYDPPDLPNAGDRRGTGMHPKDAGFDEYALFHALHTEDKGSRYANPTMLENGELKTYEGRYGEDIWVEKIVDFMERHRNEPTFVYYPMALPHRPFEPTPDAPNWDPNKVPTDDDVMHITDMVEYMDTLVGRLLDKLQARLLDKNTLVLFYGDNGFHNRVYSKLADGRVIRGGKANPTQTGIHVPLIAHWPGKVQPGICEDLIDASDFVPTLLDLAGAEAPEGTDGISFAPALFGKQTTPRDSVFVWYDPRPGWDKERFNRHVFAFDKQYKLFRSGRLYRLTDRPLEEIPIKLNDINDADRAARARLEKIIAAQSEGVEEPPLVGAYGTPQHDLLYLPKDRAETDKVTQEMLETGTELCYGDPDIPEHRLWVFNPLDIKPGELRPCVFFIHGGGWGGHPRSLAAQAIQLQRQGINTVSIHFRAPKKPLTPADTLKDARRAYRWIVEHGRKHHIDPERIVVSGGSAGGHLSLALTTIALPDDPVISPPPAGYVLYNPVIDLVDGWKGGQNKLKAANMDVRAFSPAHQVVKGLPPTLVLSGSNDSVITPKQIHAFVKRMQKAGNEAQFIEYAGAGHGFFNYGREGNKYFDDTQWAFEDFLRDLGLL